MKDAESARGWAIYNLSVNAESTSLATRQALTYGLAIPAFALARVRLEQSIVASFLIHVPVDEGFDRFLSHPQIEAEVEEIQRLGQCVR